MYYYSNENIESSYLALRQRREPYGPNTQVIGSVETREGRLLTFSNIQHQVQPFSLIDRKKPGHRKVLALFLVDPQLPILSTANVPCQPKDWWRDYISQLGTGLDRLPVELQDIVFNQEEITDAFPLGLDEAKELRLKLMDERKSLAIQQNKVFKKL